MRKLIAILLVFVSLSAAGYYYFAEGGSTTTLPASTVSRTIQWRSLGTDSLRQMWRNDGLGWNRVFTATEANFYFLTKTNTATVTNKSMSGSTNTFTAIPNSALVNNTISGAALGTNLSTLSIGNGLAGASYNGNGARSWAIDFTRVNTWTGLHTFNAGIRLTSVTGGTAGTDSLLVKKSDNLIYKIPATYYTTGNAIVEITGTTQTASVNTIYIPHNASLTTITLPSSATIGSLVQVIGEGAGRWRLQHGNASDVIVGAGGFTTVAGTTHGVEASDQNGTITVRKTNTNKWTITSSQATLSAY